MTAVHLAQLNVGRLVAPLDDPAIDEFRDNLAHVNALGESAPGFVWRLVGAGDATGATDLRWPDAPDDERFVVNLTVWTDVESLRAFAHRGEHAAFLRRRREWFEPPEGPHLVLWWIPAGHRPSLAEASERLRLLRDHAGPAAFTLRRPYPPS